MDYGKIRVLLDNLYNAYVKICGEDDVKLVIGEPVRESEVKAVEEKLGRRLPEQLRNFFLEFSGHLEFSAYLPDDFELPQALDEIFSAGVLISLDEVAFAEDSRDGWVEHCFSDKENEYDMVWHDKLGFMNVPNGDIIAFDITKEECPVVYLSHDDGEGHGYILGRDFNTYLENLILVGACGNEDWQVLPFCSDARSGIEPYCGNAEEYRRIIGLKL